MNLSKIKDSFISGSYRVLKVLQYGAKTADEVSPFGYDGNPILNMTAIYANTDKNGDKIIIGYMNKNQLSEKGESRMFSVDDSGELKSYIWNKKDGTLQLNGDSKHAVRYEDLESGLDEFKNKINQELIAVQTAISSVGGAYSRQPVTVDISDARVDTVELP